MLYQSVWTQFARRRCCRSVAGPLCLPRQLRASHRECKHDFAQLKERFDGFDFANVYKQLKMHDKTFVDFSQTCARDVAQLARRADSLEADLQHKFPNCDDFDKFRGDVEAQLAAQYVRMDLHANLEHAISAVNDRVTRKFGEILGLIDDAQV